MHGHSRKKDVFMYGNHFANEPEATRAFPYVFDKICDHFNYDACSFNLTKSKESTLRIALFRELRLVNIFTLESSFCGCSQGSLKNKHFTIDSLKEIGKDLCISILVYYDIPSI